MRESPRQANQSQAHPQPFLGRRALACAVAAALATSVGAQSDAMAQETSASEPLEEIYVTGTRIRRSPFELPAPVNMIDSATIDQSGLTQLSDVLLRTPAVTVGLGLANNSNAVEAGASFINLRGLGTDRTLVLVDGKRRVPGSRFSSAVDLSAIAPGMVERVDVITGGTSAVYGADAVTGVVNVVLKRDFEGLELNARYAPTEHGGGESTSFSLAGGTSFSDGRGNVTLGLVMTDSERLMAHERDFGSHYLSFFGNPDNTGPADGVPSLIAVRDGRFLIAPYTGIFQTPSGLYTFDSSLRPANFGTDFLPNDFVTVGGDGFDVSDWNQLRGGLKTFAATSTLSYSITDAVELFTLLDFANTRSESGYQPVFNLNMQLSRANPLLPASVAALMDQEGMTSISVNRAHTDVGARTDFTERNTYTVAGGFRGNIADRFGWEVFYQSGRMDLNSRNENQVITARLLQAIDVISGPAGQPMCRDAAARAAGCLPYLPLGLNGGDDAARAYFEHALIQSAQTTQRLGGASINGDLIELPAGALRFAAGAEYREESLRFRDDGINVTGGLTLTSGDAPVDAEFDVKEVYGELLVPLVADVPLVRRLELEGAVRYSDYSTIGSTTAWKGGLNWTIVDDVRVRYTQGRSVRAPTLSELFNPGSVGFSFIQDPCTAARVNEVPGRAANCAALGVPANFVDPQAGISREVAFGGNADLDPETSDSWTAGLVLKPRFLPALSVSIDYWEIEIEDAINSIGISDILEGCVDSATINNPFCAQITRRPDGSVQRIRNTDINIGELVATGVDFAASYELPIGSLFGEASALSFQATVTWLGKHEELVNAADPSTLILQDGEVQDQPLPRWRGNLSTTLSAGPLTLNWYASYIDAMVLDNQPPTREQYEPKYDSVPVMWYHDLYAAYALNDQIRIDLGIRNVLDEEPPYTPFTYLGGGGLYDNLGRSYFAGVNVKF